MRTVIDDHIECRQPCHKLRRVGIPHQLHNTIQICDRRARMNVSPEYLSRRKRLMPEPDALTSVHPYLQQPPDLPPAKQPLVETVYVAKIKLVRLSCDVCE